jgi:hypothetical protein
MHARPAATKESTSAGPVRSWAAWPVRTKMPVPMTAPTPRLVSCSGPRQRRSLFSPLASSRSMARGLRAKSGFSKLEPSFPGISGTRAPS